MQDASSNPVRVTVLEQLQRAAVETYGEERSAEAPLQTALGAAATAIARVMLEPLDLLGPEPTDA
jgi:hypothetical protein